MIEYEGNIWDFEHRAPLVIPTNGYVKRNGAAVMGAGLARDATERHPGIDEVLGGRIIRGGNKVYLINESPLLVSFPVKPSMFANREMLIDRYKRNRNASPDNAFPGWMSKARPDIIERSAHELVALADEEKWEEIMLPRVGCGNGQLSWTEVKKILNPILKGKRFIVVNLEKT